MLLGGLPLQPPLITPLIRSSLACQVHTDLTDTQKLVEQLAARKTSTRNPPSGGAADGRRRLRRLKVALRSLLR